jgi:hypothetical protein
LRFDARKTIENEKVSQRGQGNFMANPVIGSSNNSAYPLFLAYALVVLSLLKVDMGLIGRTGLTASGSNNVVATAFAPIRSPDEFGTHHRLLVSMLESRVNPSTRIGTDAQNEEVRRLAALALMVYVAGDGIRR